MSYGRLWCVNDHERRQLSQVLSLGAFSPFCCGLPVKWVSAWASPVWTRDHSFQNQNSDSGKTTMPSSKKARARARRAAKEAKAAAKEAEGEYETLANQDGSLEAQMQRLTMDDLLRDNAQCRHGLELESHDLRRCNEFIEAFIDCYYDKSKSFDKNGSVALLLAVEATKEKFDIWNDATKLKNIVSYCVAHGTQFILHEEGKAAAGLMFYARFFEQYIAVELEKTQANVNYHKVCGVGALDSRATVSFFRKRIPCKCLDEKYKEVKSETKMAFCLNEDCTLPDHKVELGKVLFCSGCNQACYCSKACQKAAWKEHKEYCRAMSRKIAEFDAKQRPKQC